MKPLPAPSLPTALAVASRVLRLLIPANLIIGALILALLIAGLIDERGVFNALGIDPSPRNAGMILGGRGIMVIGIASVACVHRILTLLDGIVETVRIGDPFAAVNAARLNRIAWAVLGLEVLRSVNAVIASVSATPESQFDIGWSLNFTRWITVLLLFVLARVFEHGTRMRDDLAGTV